MDEKIVAPSDEKIVAPSDEKIVDTRKQKKVVTSNSDEGTAHSNDKEAVEFGYFNKGDGDGNGNSNGNSNGNGNGNGNGKGVLTNTPIPPHMRRLHDPDVTFEEYYYYARITREEQETLDVPRAGKNLLSYLVPNLQKGIPIEAEAPEVNTSDPEKRLHITDEEWINASRAVRTATAGAVFYLITTDILGPFLLPYAFATTGWGPGVALYTVLVSWRVYLGGCSGSAIWVGCHLGLPVSGLTMQFSGLDSYQFPIVAYGDLGFRIYGSWCRYLFNILQAIQLVCNVAVIIISNGLALSEASHFKLCYAICCLVWALAGFFLGQIRTLQRFGWLANLAVFINLIIMFITMGAAAHSPPLYSATSSSAGASINPDLVKPNAQGVYPPVQQSGGLPNPSNFVAAVNGLMQAVYAYGGAMIFAEFMAEMRRPRDFLKGMWGAQLFIYCCYMFYGLFIYGYQGQYVQSPSYLGISEYALQTAGNSLAMVSSLIAASLYGNIGVKVIYNNIFVEFFKAPPLTMRQGKRLWIALVPIYWSIAYIIGAAIPDFVGFSSVVAAVCILQFTYTFPPMLHVAFNVRKNALQAGEGFDPTTGVTVLHDRGLKRYIRGFFVKDWYLNAWNVIYFLGSLATAALGIWAAVENLIAAFEIPQLNAFGCTSPLNVQA